MTALEMIITIWCYYSCFMLMTLPQMRLFADDCTRTIARREALDCCAKSCHLMLLPHLLARNSPVGHPPSLLSGVFIVTVYITIAIFHSHILTILKQCNPVFCKFFFFAIPHPLCTCTLIVLYACGQESTLCILITWYSLHYTSGHASGNFI